MLKAPSPPAIPIGDLVQGDTIKPGFPTALSPESVNFPIEGEKNFLGDIHCFRLISQHIEREVKDQILVKLEGLGESCLVHFLQAQDETFPFLKSCPGVNGMGQFSHKATLISVSTELDF